MFNKKASPQLIKLLTAAALLGFGATGVRGENVFVTSYKGATASTDVMPCPPSCVTGASLFGASTASASTASPTPVIPASGRRVVYGNATNATWSVTPTNIVVTSGVNTYTFIELQQLGAYKIYVTEGENGNTSSNLIVKVTATGGALADTNGEAVTAIYLDCFQTGKPDDVWIHVGYLTNSTPNPTVTFAYDSGFIGTTGGRWYMDAVWFQNMDPCADVAPEVKVDGPLIAGQNFVNVPNVSGDAKRVTVYAGGLEIGSTNYAAGFAAGNVAVPTTIPLVQGAVITATQTKTNAIGGECTSDPGTSAVVGAGPNSKLTTYLACWKNATNAGPIGTDSLAPSSGFPYFLKANVLTNGYGTAPAGGPELSVGECWQTVTFQNGVDDAVDLNDGTHKTNTDAFCSLDSLVFSIAETNSGPYDIYVDSIVNGDTVVEDFESYGVGSTNTFNTPSLSSLPAASGYLPSPNSATISDNFAFDGTKSLRIRWQWSTDSNIRWARTAANAASGKNYPQLDTSLPITIRYLVMPAGGTTAHKFNGEVGAITNSGVPYLSSTNILGVAVTGSGPYTYDWFFNDVSMGINAPSITLGALSGNGLDGSENGTYRVEVSDGFCTEKRTIGFTVVNPVPTITNQLQSALATLGSTAPVMSIGVDGHAPAGYPLYYTWTKEGGVILYDQTDAQLVFPAGVATTDAGVYQVQIANLYGLTDSVPANLSVVSAPIGNGTGLRGQYWTSHYYTNAFTGAPTLERTDPVVNFDWGTGAPEGISANFFTARWSGQVQAAGSDTYTFYTVSDDGVRLWVDGQQLVDNWTLHGRATNSATITLDTTTKYDVVMEYFESSGSAVAQLWWSTAGGAIPQSTVPASQLYPATSGVAVPELTYTVSNGTNLVLNWSGGSATVVWSSDVAGPYTNVLGTVVSPFTIPLGSEPTRFFRLQVQ